MYIVKYSNGKISEYKCDSKGRLPFQNRAPPRHFFGPNEVSYENHFLQELSKKEFSPEKAVSSAWLSSLFSHEGLKHDIVSPFCKLFSILLNISFTREIYRRKKCCIYWLEQNLPAIRNFLLENTIECVYNDTVIKITPPVLWKESPVQIQPILPAPNHRPVVKPPTQPMPEPPVVPTKKLRFPPISFLTPFDQPYFAPFTGLFLKPITPLNPLDIPLIDSTN